MDWDRDYYKMREKKNAEFVEASFWAAVIIAILTVLYLAIIGLKSFIVKG